MYNDNDNARQTPKFAIIFRKSIWLWCHISGKRLGGYLCNAWVTSIAYDEQAQYVFIGRSHFTRKKAWGFLYICPGDYSGAITVCHLEAQGLKFINTLKGHSGSVRTLAWDGTRLSELYSSCCFLSMCLEFGLGYDQVWMIISMLYHFFQLIYILPSSGTGFTLAVLIAQSLFGTLEVGEARSTSCMGTGARWSVVEF